MVNIVSCSDELAVDSDVDRSTDTYYEFTSELNATETVESSAEFLHVHLDSTEITSDISRALNYHTTIQFSAGLSEDFTQQSTSQYTLTQTNQTSISDYVEFSLTTPSEVPYHLIRKGQLEERTGAVSLDDQLTYTVELTSPIGSITLDPVALRKVEIDTVQPQTVGIEPSAIASAGVDPAVGLADIEDNGNHVAIDSYQYESVGIDASRSGTTSLQSTSAKVVDIHPTSKKQVDLDRQRQTGIEVEDG